MGYADTRFDDFFELVRKRRTVRKFRPDPVPDEYIEKIVEAARWAQSGANAQPWEFVIVRDRDTRARIVELQMGHRQRAWDFERTRVPELRHNVHPGAPSVLPNFKDAPVYIIVCGDPRTTQASVLITQFLNNEGGPQAHFLKNMANATQILHLAAAALGLGSQWVSVNTITEAYLKRLLTLPDELAIHTIVPVGWPAYEPPPSWRRDLKQIIHYEKYDRAKYRSGEDIYQFLLTLREKTKPAYRPIFDTSQPK